MRKMTEREKKTLAHAIRMETQIPKGTPRRVTGLVMFKIVEWQQ